MSAYKLGIDRWQPQKWEDYKKVQNIYDKPVETKQEVQEDNQIG